LGVNAYALVRETPQNLLKKQKILQQNLKNFTRNKNSSEETSSSSEESGRSSAFPLCSSEEMSHSSEEIKNLQKIFGKMRCFCSFLLKIFKNFRRTGSFF
jgi:hypothetical protein